MNAVLFILTLAILGIGSAAAQQRLPEDHPKYLVTQKVFRDLVRAIGDGRTPPTLRLLSRGAGSRLWVTWFQPEAHNVTLEERAYDVCASLGPDSLNALAWMLGHELAHCYKDHGWVADFGNALANGNGDLGYRKNPDSWAQLVAAEREADYFGGFFGQMAGYRPLEVMPRALQRIYREYQLGEDIPGYPPLEERQDIARQAAAQLGLLLPVFEAGQVLLLVKRYEEAGRCFDLIARTFPSREILNSAGMARALEALDLFGAAEAEWAYPFELDAGTRLQQKDRADQPLFEDSRKYRQKRLREAREWFEQARIKDSDYLPAYVNLAGVADLQREYEEAAFLAGKAVKLARDRGERISLAHALIVRGIARIHADPQRPEAARQDFEQAVDGAPSLARINLMALELKSGEGEAQATAYPAESERIAGREARGYEALIEAAEIVSVVPQADRSQPPLDIYVHQAEEWKGLVVEARYGVFSFLETQPGYRGRSGKGIVAGDDFARVEEAYGPPTYRVGRREGTYHVYAPARIVFHTGADNRIQGWMVYHLEK